MSTEDREIIRKQIELLPEFDATWTPETQDRWFDWFFILLGRVGSETRLRRSLIPAPEAASWKEMYGSWEGFALAAQKSMGRNLGGGVVKFATPTPATGATL
jgi:hypothetical protein